MKVASKMSDNKDIMKKIINPRQIYLPSQLTPEPLYPVVQVHVKLPFVLAQTALASQLWRALVHSLISERKEEVMLVLIRE